MEGTITRRMNSVWSALELEYSKSYTDEDIIRTVELMEETLNEGKREALSGSVVRMLRECGISAEENKGTGYYLNLIHENKDKITNSQEIEESLLLQMFQMYRDFPSPDQFLLRLVNRLENPEDDWKADSLRLRILKQAIKYGGWLEQSGYKGKACITKWVKERTGNGKPGMEDILNSLTDEIFGAQENAKKEQKKPDGTYGLLAFANNMASSLFRGQGATRRELYLFAMLYNMSFYCGMDGTIPDEETDVEKKLFQDYYSSNLARFLFPAYQGAAAGGLETDPDGQGINYKNFAEMVCLYCIARPWTPEEKLTKAAEMINALKSLPAAEENDVPATRVFRDNVRAGEDGFDCESILLKDEQDFMDYLAMHYNCHAGSKSPFSLESTRATAVRVYQEVTDELTVTEKDVKLQQKEVEDMKRMIGLNKADGKDDLTSEMLENSGLWLSDVNASENVKTRNFAQRHPELDQKECGDFIQVLKKMDALLRQGRYQKDGSVTRSGLVAVCHQLYNLYSEEETERKNLQETYEDFASFVNYHLETAGYQPLNHRSLFDLLVVLSCYCYANV